MLGVPTDRSRAALARSRNGDTSGRVPPTAGQHGAVRHKSSTGDLELVEAGRTPLHQGKLTVRHVEAFLARAAVESEQTLRQFGYRSTAAQLSGDSRKALIA